MGISIAIFIHIIYKKIIMNKLELLNSISKYLSRFTEQVTILNGNAEFSINRIAEDILIKLFDFVIADGFENMNRSDKSSYPAIDLLNKSKRIAIQVTASRDLQKVKKTIEGYFSNQIYKDSDELFIYVLTTSQQKYDQKSINKCISDSINELVKTKVITAKEDIKFEFNATQKIIDKRFIYNSLSDEKDINKIAAVEKYLSDNFGKIELQNNLDKYQADLASMYDEVVMADINGMTLRDSYVEPSFLVHSSIIDANAQSNDSGYIHADERYSIHEFVNEVIEGKNPLKFKKLPRVILLFGYPGQGKTSFSKRLINDILTNGGKSKNLYFFRLRDISSVKDFIRNPISTLLTELNQDYDFEIRRSEFTKSILILDGLDELYMREDLKLDEIDRLCIDLIREADKNEELQIVITSRNGYVDKEKLFRENILMLHLAVFSLDKQIAWLDRYKVFHPTAWLDEKKIRKYNTPKFKHLQELINQPILLHMIASLKNEVDEKTTKSKIYAQLFSELIERRYSSDGQIENLKGITENDLRELLREISFGIFKSGENYISKGKLLRLDGVKKFQEKLPTANFKETIKGVMIAFYFQEVKKKVEDEDDDTRSNYAIEFLHKSLQEYMTAEKIYSTLKYSFLDKKTFSKDYIIDNYYDAMKILTHLFGARTLSYEITNYLSEIMADDTQEVKSELADRLFKFINQFLGCNFLLEFNSKNLTENTQEIYPINTAISTFSAYWFFLTNLGVENYYKYLNRNHDLHSIFQVALLHVRGSDLVDFKDKHIDQVNFNSLKMSDAVAYNTRFSECDFSATDLRDTEIEKVTFIKCNFFDTFFSGGRLMDVIFKECKFSYTTFGLTTLSNVIFEDCKIYQMPFNFYESKDRNFEIHFKGITTLDEDVFENILAHKITIDRDNCIFELDDNETTEHIVEDIEEIEDSDNYKRLLVG